MNMSGVSESNPFLSTQYLPLFEKINIDNFGYKTMRMQIDEQRESYKLFEQTLTEDREYNFSEVFDKLDSIDHPLSNTYGIISHLSSVCDSKSLRDIKDTFRSELVDLGKMSSQSIILYNALRKIKKATEHEQRALDLSIQGMERGGVNLPDEEKSKLTDLDKTIAELTNKLNENVLDSTKSYKLIVTDKNMMSNTPLWCRELWCPETPKEGPWTITLSGPSMMAALKYIPDSNTRKTLYLNYIRRAESNEEVVCSLLDLKTERANILGFDTFTKLSLSSKMASTEEEIIQLLNELQDVSLPKAIEENEEIKSYARSKQGVDDIEPWDVAFWSERMQEEKFQLKEEDTKPYLPLDNVLKELFSIANRLFGIYIKERETKVEVWHPSVRFFDVYDGHDDTCEIIAGFYLDPYAREETKQSGAWMNSCVDKNRALQHFIPIAYLVCNGTPPSKDKPSLMTFSEVETLFHEFGHGLQHMLTKVDVSGISGIDGIEWDAVELPSQFMENWCYDKQTLDNMAIHYITGEKLPDSMYESLLEKKNFGAGMAMMRQISFAKLDLYLYSNWKQIKEEEKSIWDIQKSIFMECCPYKRYLDEDKFLCTFQHIFSGYSAGYYSYKWAEIMSADSFAAFEEDPENQRDIGRRFRNTVLSNGGSKPAMDTFTAFRGRKPSVKALLRHNKLV